MDFICEFKESEDLTILTCFYAKMWSWDDKMKEEKKIRECRQKRK